MAFGAVAVVGWQSNTFIIYLYEAQILIAGDVGGSSCGWWVVGQLDHSKERESDLLCMCSLKFYRIGGTYEIFISDPSCIVHS